MELADLLPRPFNTLSNGEMRRVLFARAVLTNPKRLILDDPMAGLDPRQRERFRRMYLVGQHRSVLTDLGICASEQKCI